MTDDLYSETEETSEEEDQQQTSSATPDPDEIRRLKKANRELLKEVKEERKARRDSEFTKLKEKFPNLEPEDIEGIPTSKLDAILAKVVPAPKTQEESEEEIPAEEQAELVKFTRAAGGQGTQQAPTPIAALDAHKKYTEGEWTQAQYLEWMRQQPLKR